MKPLLGAQVHDRLSRPALIIGTGNISRAATYALGKLGWSSIVVLDVLGAEKSAQPAPSKDESKNTPGTCR